MRINVPPRFSTKWWLWLTNGAVFFGICTAAVTVWFGLVSDPTIVIFVVLAGSLIGDLILAFSFEAIAPVKVTVGPGDRYRRTDDLREMASVVAGFSSSSVGKVRIRGEIWSARHYAGRDLSLDAGEMVKVVEREGLVLLIGEAQ